jgi:hypothetical protein
MFPEYTQLVLALHLPFRRGQHLFSHPEGRPGDPRGAAFQVAFAGFLDFAWLARNNGKRLSSGDARWGAALISRGK